MKNLKKKQFQIKKIIKVITYMMIILVQHPLKQFKLI